MKRTMALVTLLALGICLSAHSFAQEEDPTKLLGFQKKEQFDIYLSEYGWKADKKSYSDSLDGEYYLYSKKTLGGGNSYIAVYPGKFIHYMVFFEAKKPYSKVLSYEEFIHMPEGKSRFNSSNENKIYAIKSISFDDPNENRNQNIFFGKTPLKEGMSLTPIANIKGMSKKQAKALKKKEEEKEIKEINEEIILEEKLNEEDYQEQEPK